MRVGLLLDGRDIVLEEYLSEHKWGDHARYSSMELC